VAEVSRVELESLDLKTSNPPLQNTQTQTDSGSDDTYSLVDFDKFDPFSKVQHDLTSFSKIFKI
jgi:hypothetical protein